MPIQKPTLQNRIEQCSLLQPQQRQALLSALPSMTPAQQQQLAAILDREQPVLQQAMRASIALASERNDTAFFAGMDRFFAAATTVLSKAEEPLERADDAQKLEHFFDDAA